MAKQSFEVFTLRENNPRKTEVAVESTAPKAENPVSQIDETVSDGSEIPEPEMAPINAFTKVEDMLAYMKTLKESANPTHQAAAEAMSAAQEEAAKAQTEVAEALPKIEEIGKNTMKHALNRLGVLGIPKTEVVNSVQALRAMGYADPNEIRQLTYRPFVEKMPEIPDFLKLQNEQENKGWLRRNASGFIDKFKSWWGNKKWERAKDGSKTSAVSELLNGIGAAGMLLLALLGGHNSEGDKNSSKPEKPAITGVEKPKAEIPNIVVPDVGPSALELNKVTEDMKKECQKGKYNIMINCIKSTVGAQSEKVRAELTEKIFDAAQARAKSEKVNWDKLTLQEKNAYVDAVLGGDSKSPSAKIAKELGLDKVNYTFTGLDDLQKQGIKVAMPKTPKYVPAAMVIKYINELGK